MKKIIKIIVILLIIVVIGVLGYNYLNKRNKDYELDTVETYNYYPLLENEKYGIIDLSGNVLINPQYKQVVIPNPSKDVFVCMLENGKSKILNAQGEEILKGYEEVNAIKYTGTISNMPYEKTVLSYKEGEKYGLIDYNGKKITKAIYEEILSVPYKEGEILVKKDGKYGVINNKSAVLIDFEYDEIKGDGYYDDSSKYKEAGYIVGNKTQDGFRYGYINKKFEKILDVEYNNIYRVMADDDKNNAYLVVKKNGFTGVVYNKKTIIECKFQDVEFNNENKTFFVQKDSKYGVYDMNGTNIVPAEYDYVKHIGNYIYAKLNDEVKYFDIFGNETVDIEYMSINSTNNVIYNITVTEDNSYGIIDGKQNVLVENMYSYLDYLFDNYFIALKDSKYGIIDSDNNIIIEFEYDVLQKIGDTNVIQGKMYSNNNVDIYSKELNKVYTIENASIIKANNYIKIYSEKETKYFDLDGKEKKNTEIFENNELYVIEKNGKWGMADKNGNTIVECIYDKVTELNEYGFAGIKLNDKWGVINKNGQVILEPVYEHFHENEEPEFIGQYYRVTYGYGEAYYTSEE